MLIINRTYLIIGCIAAGLVLAGLATVWHRSAVQDVVDQAVQGERARAQEATRLAIVEARAENQKLATQAAINELESKIEQDRLKEAARRAADRARSADDRLQRATADLRRHAAASAEAGQCGSLAHGAASAATALGECSGRYRALGAVADGLTGQVIGLQRFLAANECFPVSPRRPAEF